MLPCYHDYVRAFSPGSGVIRVPLVSPKASIPLEDFYSFATLSLEPEELRLSVKKAHGVDWDPSTVFIGIYDGHGGSAVSQYLRQELHGLVESALKPPSDLEARMTQAFFEVDRNLSADSGAQSCGATASVAILHSLDSPATPFFSSQKLSLTDTRPMTENHHADARVEAIRLRRMMGSSLITDSFGESRWMGALANTRCLGDMRYKKFGVTPEPEVRTKLLEGL
ncbi:phosphatase 2C-like domain-containing protein [Mycena leptocephala]|nr:phosphatase 2C-like domain-containing protein [Mycena leptocephala]